MLAAFRKVKKNEYSQIVHHDSSHVDVVVGSCRAVDDDWATDTIAILDQVMRVIPRGTILSSLPRVCAGLTWGKSALCNTWNTVVGVCAQLTDTVPMDSSTVVAHVISDFDNNIVTPVALDGRARDSGWASVVRDSQALTAGAIKVAGSVGDSQAVLAGLSSVRP